MSAAVASSAVAPGANVVPDMTNGVSPGFCTNITVWPASPEPAGSVTPRASDTATAASIALPPACRIRTPASVASGDAALTMPADEASAAPVA